MLREEMDMVKGQIAGRPFVERMTARINVEDDHEKDYLLVHHFNELQLKAIKADKRLEKHQLGIYCYGRGLAKPDGSLVPEFKEALKCIRTQLTEKKPLRQRDSITEEEIEMLEEKYRGEDMPDDGKIWVYIGFCYQNADNVEDNERSY